MFRRVSVRHRQSRHFWQFLLPKCGDFGEFGENSPIFYAFHFSPNSPISPRFEVKGADFAPRKGLLSSFRHELFYWGWEGFPRPTFHRHTVFPCAFFYSTRSHQMKPTTNIYILADTSFRMAKHTAKLQQTFTQYERALSFQREKTKLVLIGYNDRAKLLAPHGRITATGNPNLGEGLNFLSSVLTLEGRRHTPRSQSVFLLFTGENVLQGWQPPLQELFNKHKEFAFGLRYVITQAQPDRYTQKVAQAFVDSPDRILYHFSTGRLSSLISSLQYNCKFPQPIDKHRKMW